MRYPRPKASFTPEPWVLAAVCAYELGGLAGCWPTITSLSMRLGRGARLIEATLAYLWLLRHFDVWRRRWNHPA